MTILLILLPIAIVTVEVTSFIREMSFIPLDWIILPVYAICQLSVLYLIESLVALAIIN